MISFIYSKPFSLYLSKNIINIFAVACESSTALWCFSSAKPKVLFKSPNPYFFKSGNKSLAICKVSITEDCKSIFKYFLISLFINPISKGALCATKTASPIKSTNFPITSSILGSLATCSSVMLVISVIWYGIGLPGLISCEYLSTILPAFIFTAPISIISLVCEFKPVVSISNTTNSSSSIFLSFGFVTIGASSSIIYISQPKIAFIFSSSVENFLAVLNAAGYECTTE